MNQLISHIEFLLHDHNCVIIPEFGGFVVNTIPPQRDGIAAFHAPACELVFNRDLIHNDGLLAQSYMKCSDMVFEAAMQKVELDVQLLKRQLREQRMVDMGKLGSFEMHDDKRFVYTPRKFVRPALFGLSHATLKPLVQMQPLTPLKESGHKQRWSRSAAITAASVAAIVLLMFVLPMNDSTIARQSARMLSESVLLQSKATQPTVNSVKEEVASPISNIHEEEVLITSAEATLPAPDVATQPVIESSPKYYIVMGVYRGVESAQKSTDLLHDEGFHQTGWLERSDRIDVYAASFSDESAAKIYLKEVHKKFPSHHDAWILKR